MIRVIDYDMGNLHSVMNTLAHIGIEAEISGNAESIRQADGLILPGVGGFPDAVKSLKKKGLFDVIKEECEKGKPIFGICLGMQLLFETGYEFETCDGLGLIEGSVKEMSVPGLKLPHIGWNSLYINKNDVLLEGINEGDYVYFVHSFQADTSPSNVICYTKYGNDVPALVRNKKLNVWGAQFHPEKSHNSGLKLLKNYCDFVMRGDAI